MTTKLDIYYRLPYRVQMASASLWGYYLRGWRYGKHTTALVEAAWGT